MERVPSPLREQPLRQGLHDEQDALRPEMVRELRVDPDRLRLRTGNANVDPYDIGDIALKYAPTRGTGTPAQVAKEIDFNWKRYEIYGKPDYSEMQYYEHQGWRPVLHEMFPGRFGPLGTTGKVVVKDMILMERPMTLTVQARSEEIQAATRAMQVHRQQTMRETKDGQAPRIVYADRTSRETIEIPE
jgi:hypothetical protein